MLTLRSCPGWAGVAVLQAAPSLYTWIQIRSITKSSLLREETLVERSVTHLTLLLQCNEKHLL